MRWTGSTRPELFGLRTGGIDGECQRDDPAGPHEAGGLSDLVGRDEVQGSCLVVVVQRPEFGHSWAVELIKVAVSVPHVGAWTACVHAARSDEQTERQLMIGLRRSARR